MKNGKSKHIVVLSNEKDQEEPDMLMLTQTTENSKREVR